LSNTISAYCAMDVGPDGTVYVAWIDFSTTPEQLVVRKSTDGGATFGNLVKVSDVFSIQGSLPNNSFRVGTLPDMATARNGDVHIVWADDRFRCSGHGSDVLIASSTDEGNTWTVRVVNSQDTTNTDQFDPTIDIGYEPTGKGTTMTKNVGTIHVFYYDKKYATTPANTLIDVTEAHSHSRATDTFSLTRVTDTSMDCRGVFFMGDYIDTSVNKFNRGVWTDCRNRATSGTDIFNDTVSPS